MNSFKAYTWDMIMAAWQDAPDGNLYRLEVTPRKTEEAYKITILEGNNKGTIHVVDARNQPGSYHYELPKNGVHVKGSVDEQLEKLASEDKAAGVVLPSKDVACADVFSRIFDGSKEMQAVRSSLGIKEWYVIKTAPTDDYARFYVSFDGAHLFDTREDGHALRCARSIPLD